VNPPLDLNLAGAQTLGTASGCMELLVDPASSPRKGLAVVLHPQPLMGGSARHKVPDYLAKGLAAQGWTALRPNFRGVGASTGTHDQGRGECDDVLALVQVLRQEHPGERLALVGFSFGAYVAACVAKALDEAGHPLWRTVLLGMPYGDVPAGRRYDTPRQLPDALVVHGEQDSSVPLAAVVEWARPAAQPVLVVPGADHFFTGRLPQLRKWVLRHLQ
jgi:uncharacterized protein